MTTGTRDLHLDVESCYRAVKSRDRRFDGDLLHRRAHHRDLLPAVLSGPHARRRRTSRSSRPRRPPRRPASGPASGACPTPRPGSPDWDVAADVAGRAMRLIADGVVDRDGVDGPGPPGRLHAAPPHPAAHRRARRRPAGAGPRAPRPDRAGADRDHRDDATPTSRSRPGFASVRQFNDTIREVYAASPTDLRGRRGGPRSATGRSRCDWRCGRRSPAGRCSTSSAYAPIAGRRGGRRRAGTPAPSTCRTAPAPSGSTLGDEPDARARPRSSPRRSRSTDLRDTAAAVERARRLLDADCDPVAVDDQFAGDPVIGPLVRRTPGLRVPGQVDGDEIAVRAVLGQQVSVAGALHRRRPAGGRARPAGGRPTIPG